MATALATTLDIVLWRCADQWALHAFMNEGSVILYLIAIGSIILSQITLRSPCLHRVRAVRTGAHRCVLPLRFSEVFQFTEQLMILLEKLVILVLGYGWRQNIFVGIGAAISRVEGEMQAILPLGCPKVDGELIHVLVVINGHLDCRSVVPIRPAYWITIRTEKRDAGPRLIDCDDVQNQAVVARPLAVISVDSVFHIFGRTSRMTLESTASVRLICICPCATFGSSISILQK